MLNNGRDTLLTLNTRTGVRKSKNENYSSYWMDFDDEVDAITAEDIVNPERIIKLASIRRATANFVRILTNDSDIKVVFSSGKDSYTDGREVVIAADDDSKNFDSVVGLALHEGSHCLLSDFNLLKNLLGDQSQGRFVTALNDKVINAFRWQYVKYECIINNNAQISAVQKVMQTILNIVEDRRIDTYVYRNAAGYRPYYNAMYKKYFYNSDITKNLRHNSEWRKPTVENYLNWLIHIFHPDFDRNALPGLTDIVDMIDLKNIRRFDNDVKMPKDYSMWIRDRNRKAPWANLQTILHPSHGPVTSDMCNMIDYDTLPSIWHLVNDITHEILKYVSVANLNSMEEPNNPVVINIDGLDIDINIDSFGKLPNLDMGAPIIVDGKYNEKRAQKAMEGIKNVMNKKNRRKKLSKKEVEDINHLESAEAKICEAGDKIIGQFPCLVTRKINKQILLSEWFPFSSTMFNSKTSKIELRTNNRTDEAVRKGTQMGQILVHRLQIRNDPVVTTFTRQEHGKIDRRILAQLGMDIEQVFKRTTVDTFRPVMLHLSIDASGSMSGEKWEKCISVATALAYVSNKIRNIETVITIRGDNNIPMVSVVHDSRKDNFQQVKSIFPYLQCSGSTPEGLCFKATLDLITECTTNYDTYFINFSDGEPGTSVRRRGEIKSYSGITAVDHTRRQVQTMREAGVKILSYFIGYRSNKNVYTSKAVNDFRKMYGEEATFVNVENVSDVLRTLNKLLLKRG